MALPKPTGLLLLAVALAFLAALLLGGAAWGLNVGLWTTAVGVGILVATRGTEVPRSTKALGAVVVAFAWLPSLRDSDALRVADGFAMALGVGAMLLPLAGQRLRDVSLGRLLGAPFRAVWALATGALGLAERVHAEREATTAGQRSKAVLRGILLAAPLLVVFGALFASADAVFRTQLENLGRFDLDGQRLADDVLVFSAGLAFAGGLLYRLTLGGGPRLAPRRVAKAKPVGMIEGGVVLGSLTALFGSFLLVQFRYLFGAQDVVRATHGLSYAEYARGGFFELVIVAALTLVVLVGADALFRRDRPLDESIFRWLGRILGGMVFLIVASALLRMRLYTDAFGLTELRVYSTVFMLWLVLAFVWLFATTLCGHSQRLAFGLFVSGLGMIFATNLADPDALIVRTNLAKPNADFAYLATLGDDAALTLRSMRNAVPAAHADECDALIQKKAAGARRGDWRELNLATWKIAHYVVVD